MFAILNPDYQRLKAEACPVYRKKLKLAGSLASISNRRIRTAEEFAEAKMALESVRDRIGALPTDRDKENLLQLKECADWRVVGKRIIHYENKDGLQILVNALGRGPEPKKEQGRIKVTVTQ